MKFVSEINNVEYNINLNIKSNYYNNSSIGMFQLSVVVYSSDRQIGLQNTYPKYNKDSGIINWRGLEDLYLPLDLKDFCQRCVDNRFLL